MVTAANDKHGVDSYESNTERKSLKLNPSCMLAAIGQCRGELPDPYAHACAFRVQVELPLAIFESELVACRRGILRCRVDWRAGGGRAAVFDRLQTMHAGEHSGTPT